MKSEPPILLPCFDESHLNNQAMSILHLCIKPSFSSFECHIALPSHKSVSDLKTEISSQFEGNPSPADQRLIYRGKQLSDTDTLAVALGANVRLVLLLAMRYVSSYLFDFFRCFRVLPKIRQLWY
jgi:hypothetical protein